MRPYADEGSCRMTTKERVYDEQIFPLMLRDSQGA